jgi:hypothetical protein
LTLQSDFLVSKFAFKCNLYRYKTAMGHDEGELRAAPWLFEVLLRLGKNEDATWRGCTS